MVDILVKDNKLYVASQYDKNLLQFMRSRQKRFWNTNTKKWEIPESELDNLIEVLQGYEYNIRYDGEQTESHTVLEQSEKLPIKNCVPDWYEYKTKPYQHQVDGISYGLMHDNFLLADEQGCIDGDMEVEAITEYGHFKGFLRDLFHMFIASLDKDKYKILCYIGGCLMDYYPLKKVLYSGEKECYCLQLEDGSYIIGTPDHEILTNKGYIPLMDVISPDYNTYVYKQDEEVPTYTKLVKADCLYYVGTKSVYDVVMKDPFRNFVANNIVVHNCGKAQPLDSVIYTPTGKTTMGSLTIGTDVIGSDGNTYQVTNIFDKGILPVYKITFTDKSYTFCCKDHLWAVVPQRCYRKNKYKVVDTNFLMDAYKNKRYYIPIVKPVGFTNSKEFIIHPYILGVLLGDGSIIHHVAVTTIDNFILDKLNKLLPDNYIFQQPPSLQNEISYILKQKERQKPNQTKYFIDDVFIGDAYDVHNWLVQNNCIKESLSLDNLRCKICPASLKKHNFIMYKHKWKIIESDHRYSNIIRYELKSLGLLGKNSHTKFIPDSYKYSDIESRIQLLQGLMDTDGYIGKGGLMQYTSVSTQLLNDVSEIVMSLGGTATIQKNKTTITIHLPKDIQPVTLPRKVERLNADRFEPSRIIENIEYAGEKHCRCITVNSPDSLYVTDNFICTHNTKQILDLTQIRKKQNNIKHVLIVPCVNGLKYNWFEEVKTHTNDKAFILGTRYTKNGERIGSNEDRLADINSIGKGGIIDDCYYLITNIETLRYNKVIKVPLKTKKNGVQRYKKQTIFPIIDAIQQQIRDGNIGMVVIDEAHKCKDPNSLQGRALISLNCDYKVALTGTPVMNNPVDVYTILHWLGFEEHSLFAFKQHYCIFGGFGNHQIVGYKNLPELQGVLDKCMLRRLKSEVLDLPEKIYINDFVEMTAQQTKLYNEVKENIIQNIDKIKLSPNPLVQLIRLRQVTGNPNLLSSKATTNPKFDRMLELIEDAVTNGSKCIVYSNWTDVLIPAYELAKEKKYCPALYTGQNKDDREKEKKRFMEDEKCKVIFGTMDAMGTGLTLTAANTVIFLDEPWNRAKKDQCEDRVHRIGTKQSPNIITIMCRGTIDERIHDIVYKKGKMSDILIDKEEDILKNPKLVNYLLSID